MGIVADRYSEALFELAQEANCLEVIEQAVSDVLHVFQEQADLVKLINNPLLTADIKCDVLQRIFGQDLDKSVLHFLFVMIRRNRAYYVGDALKAFVEKSHQARGIVTAVVSTVKELSAEQEQELLAKLQEITGKHVIIEKRIDSSLIGGLVIQLGDLRIDGSVARRLEELKNNLLRHVAQ